MRYYLALVLSLVVFCSAQSFKFDLSKSAMKKLNKTISEVWPNQNIVKKPITLTDTQKKQITFNLNKNTLYNLISNSKTEAYLFLSKGFGKMNEFDYMVLYDRDLTIIKIKLLVYREEYGGEIGSKRWLKQFVGKSNPEKMKFGHDIQNISGATISARSLTEDVKNVTKRIIELKKKNILN